MENNQAELNNNNPTSNAPEATANTDGGLLTFGGHLEVLRQMLWRVIGVTALLAIVVFCLKDTIFPLLLAPSEWDFVTYRGIEQMVQALGFEFRFEPWHVDLIATDLSSQFMTHVTTSLYIGALFASPYIVFELFRFVSPALYENERKYSVQIILTVYVLFFVGLLMTYYVLFPISFRFLGTYSVAERIHSTITLDSYISTFLTLALMMGVVFQLPVVAFFLGRMGIFTSEMLSQYRKHAFILILIVAAIITPPDLMTLLLVSLPLYLLYEVSIRVVRWTTKK
ncbi:MAG: twin-arginine translocase subunit TatC [Bacteroidaceae bacterium]|nr:twin-arginine translocase subunit TatC [Bacteroidaceae bacterium]